METLLGSRTCYKSPESMGLRVLKISKNLKSRDYKHQIVLTVLKLFFPRSEY